MGRASVLEDFILKPDRAPNEFRVLCREGRVVSGCVNVSSMSSAKRESLHSSCHNHTPPYIRLERMAAARGSKFRIKSKGESGQPCLVPFRKGNGCDRWEASWTWEEGIEYNAHRAWRKEPQKP